MGQMANTLGSGPWAYVFAASAASAAKCFHTEVWARRHFAAEAAETAKTQANAYDISESLGPEATQ